MDAELKSLQIDRGKKRPRSRPMGGALDHRRHRLAVVLLARGDSLTACSIARDRSRRQRVKSARLGTCARRDVMLNATGYIVAAHKIELAAKVIGKVSWIGVEKGDQVKEGQELVRLEDDEYRAQVLTRPRAI